MNHNLLIVLAVCADDGPVAEKLLDYIYALNGKQTCGHILLAYAHDVHGEMKLKAKLCAELAFESVSEFTATNRAMSAPNLKPIELKTKVEFINNLWCQTAYHIAGHFRWPWLWTEPDCVPIVPNWIGLLSEAYQKQPKKFMGRKMKQRPDSEQTFLSRVAIYPVSAYAELAKFIGSPPFEWVSGPHVVPRSTTSKLFQETRYDGDLTKLDLSAALLHSDKTGKLIEQLHERNSQATEHQNGESVEVKVSTAPAEFMPTFDYAPPEPIIRDLVVKEVKFSKEPPIDIEPTDRRTKLWKEWKKRNDERFLGKWQKGEVKGL